MSRDVFTPGSIHYSQDMTAQSEEPTVLVKAEEPRIWRQRQNIQIFKRIRSVSGSSRTVSLKALGLRETRSRLCIYCIYCDILPQSQTASSFHSINLRRSKVTAGQINTAMLLNESRKNLQLLRQKQRTSGVFVFVLQKKNTFHGRTEKDVVSCIC